MSQNNGSHDHDNDHEDDDIDDGLVGALIVYSPGTDRMDGVIVLDLDSEDHDRYYVPDEDASPEQDIPGFASMLDCLEHIEEALDRVGRGADIVSEDTEEWDSDIVLYDGNWAVIRTGESTWGVWGADPDEEDAEGAPPATLVEFAQADSPMGAVQAFLREYETDVIEAFLEAVEEWDEDDAEA